MKTYSVSRVGENKSVNQDCFLCEKDAVGDFSNLFIVADGMGGYSGGEFASGFCVDYVRDYIAEKKGGDTVISTIREAVREANEKLRSKVAEKEAIAHCGTTAVIATIKDGLLYVANVGDSRLYVLSDGELVQITEDHSLVEEMIKKGHISKEDARFHPDKHIVTKAIGSEPVIEPDFFEVGVKTGDRILICSDGVSNMMEEGEIKRFLSSDRSLRDIGEELVNTAKNNGGKDDITAVIIEV